MLNWISKPDSLGRALVFWVSLIVTFLTYLFSTPALLAEGSTPAWVGYTPFVLAFVAYLFYRRANPIAAIADIGREMAQPVSTGRAWLVGIAVGVCAIALFLTVIPSATVDEHEWLVWIPIAVAAVFGFAARDEPNPFRAFVIGLRRTLQVASSLIVVAIAIGLIVGGVAGLSVFVASYGILGLIAILLGIIALQLGRIARRF